MRSHSMSGSFGAYEQARHERGHALPAFCLRQKLFAPAASQRVILGLAIVVGDAPFRRDPTALFEPQKGRIERALVELEKIRGNLLNDHGGLEPVQRTQSFEGLEHYQIERALQHFAARL